MHFNILWTIYYSFPRTNILLNEVIQYPICACAFCVFLVILMYFNYLMYTDPLKTRWEFITLIGLPFFIIFPSTFMISFEILYHRKVRKRISFHLKRFIGQMFFLLVSTLWFFGILIIMQPVLSPIVGDRDFLVSSFLSSIIFAIAVIDLEMRARV